MEPAIVTACRFARMPMARHSLVLFGMRLRTLYRSDEFRLSQPSANLRARRRIPSASAVWWMRTCRGTDNWLAGNIRKTVMPLLVLPTASGRVMTVQHIQISLTIHNRRSAACHSISKKISPRPIGLKPRMRRIAPRRWVRFSPWLRRSCWRWQYGPTGACRPNGRPARSRCNPLSSRLKRPEARVRKENPSKQPSRTRL